MRICLDSNCLRNEATMSQAVSDAARGCGYVLLSDVLLGEMVILSSAGKIPLSLKRWRSAEQQVVSLLTAQGWAVRDVSRQNIGYDIEGTTPEGEEVFIDVKAIDRPGQAFILTSNEEAVARQKGSRYLSLFCQSWAVWK